MNIYLAFGSLNNLLPIFTLPLLIMISFLFFAGIYVCPKCGHELFSAKAKYKHNTPWPAFTETIRDDSVSKVNETEAQQSSKAKALKVCNGIYMSRSLACKSRHIKGCPFSLVGETRGT